MPNRGFLYRQNRTSINAYYLGARPTNIEKYRCDFHDNLVHLCSRVEKHVVLSGNCGAGAVSQLSIVPVKCVAWISFFPYFLLIFQV